MIRQIKLKNFRKHEDRTFTFSEGLTAIKGANEAGKSTLTESMLYALFGTSALRDSLADVVTWGRKESELKVELTIEVEGRLFNFKRGKSGAECEYDGGLVTGQKEVSNFASEVLGAEMNTVTRLMLANQNSLRGALEEGPKAVAQQIEVLANFDLFDRILEAAQTKLTQGSTAVFEAKVRDAEQALAQAEPTPPNTDELQQEIQTLTDSIGHAERSMESLSNEKSDADSALQSAEQVTQMRNMLTGNLKKAQDALELHKVQKADADAKAAITVDEALITRLKNDLADAEGWARRMKVHEQMVALMETYPVAHWEGTKESFEAEVDTVEAVITAQGNVLAEQQAKSLAAERKISDLRSRIITTTTCPSCGQDLKDKAKIELQNKQIKNEIASLDLDNVELYRTLKGIENGIKEKREELRDLKAVAKAAAPFEKFATQHGEFVDVDFNFYPPKLTFKSAVQRGTTHDPKEIQQRIVSLESAKEERERANARSAALTETIKSDEESIERLQQQLGECPPAPNLDGLKERARKLGNQIVLLREDIAGFRLKVREIETQIQQAQADYQSALKGREMAAALLESARDDLDQINFNNALLKKIRGARPLIADKLWNSVLAAVSTMFSQMRGEQSVVTKDKEGFKVNGCAVTSLSGSTLDLLGLAIRVALVKTFLPHTAFICLDEPAHGCDDDRTAAMLGFIAAAGFNQTIIVSHETATEAMANNVISL